MKQLSRRVTLQVLIELKDGVELVEGVEPQGPWHVEGVSRPHTYDVHDVAERVNDLLCDTTSADDTLPWQITSVTVAP